MSTCSLEDVLKIINNNIPNVNNVNPEGSGVNNLTCYNLSPEVRLLEAPKISTMRQIGSSGHINPSPDPHILPNPCFPNYYYFIKGNFFIDKKVTNFETYWKV
jgi:hypothetical protein